MNLSAVSKAIQHTMVSKTGPELRREFDKTTSTWNDKPVFKTEQYSGTAVMWLKVFTYSEKYRLVNAGAKPHDLRPRKAKFLRFQTGFKAKTRSHFIGSNAGGKSGNYISTPAVHHPGFEAREFDQTIADEYADTFREDIQDAISQGIAHK